MSITTVEYARAYLVSKQGDLTERLAAIERDRRHALQPTSADAEDRATESENDEVLDYLLISTEAELTQVRRALERLAAGRYGSCEYCGGKIAEARLRALPEATRCSRCLDSRSVRPGQVRGSAPAHA